MNAYQTKSRQHQNQNGLEWYILEIGSSEWKLHSVIFIWYEAPNTQNQTIFATIFFKMISVSNISYFIGGRALYQNASMFIKPNDKIGLIGLNGRGKSTLLKIINGEIRLDAGSISKAKDCTIGFLNQDLLSY